MICPVGVLTSNEARWLDAVQEVTSLAAGCVSAVVVKNVQVQAGFGAVFGLDGSMFKKSIAICAGAAVISATTAARAIQTAIADIGKPKACTFVA